MGVPCGKPVFNNVQGWSTCNAVTCDFDNTTGRIKVLHSHKDHLNKHVCTYKQKTEESEASCECKCKSLAAPALGGTDKRQNGQHSLRRQAQSVTCDVVHFPKVFTAVPRVLVSAGYQGAPDNQTQQDAATVWVQRTLKDRFYVCTRTPLEYIENAKSTGKPLQVQWMASLSTQ